MTSDPTTPESGTIIVTGSNGRIGDAVMRRFAGRFADVIGFDRKAPKPPPGCVYIPVEITAAEEIGVDFHVDNWRWAGAAPNLIALRIQPNKGITIAFAAKQPGAAMQSVPVEAEFSYARTFPAALADAYTTLLLEAMRGDGTLFTRRDEVEAAWRIVTPIEEAWAQLPPPAATGQRRRGH
jgi:hypothetical protein